MCHSSQKLCMYFYVGLCVQQYFKNIYPYDTKNDDNA